MREGISGLERIRPFPLLRGRKLSARCSLLGHQSEPKSNVPLGGLHTNPGIQPALAHTRLSLRGRAGAWSSLALLTTTTTTIMTIRGFLEIQFLRLLPGLQKPDSEVQVKEGQVEGTELKTQWAPNWADGAESSYTTKTCRMARSKHRIPPDTHPDRRMRQSLTTGTSQVGISDNLPPTLVFVRRIGCK